MTVVLLHTHTHTHTQEQSYSLYFRCRLEEMRLLVNSACDALLDSYTSCRTIHSTLIDSMQSKRDRLSDLEKSLSSNQQRLAAIQGLKSNARATLITCERKLNGIRRRHHRHHHHPRLLAGCVLTIVAIPNIQSCKQSSMAFRHTQRHWPSYWSEQKASYNKPKSMRYYTSHTCYRFHHLMLNARLLLFVHCTMCICRRLTRERAEGVLFEQFITTAQQQHHCPLCERDLVGDELASLLDKVGRFTHAHNVCLPPTASIVLMNVFDPHVCSCKSKSITRLMILRRSFARFNKNEMYDNLVVAAAIRRFRSLTKH
jgi:hypothetical protein